MQIDTSTIIQSVILGIIQGFTEFIPVSSSGHLQVVPDLFGWEHPSTVFILFVHLGTLIALVVYFRQDLLNYLKVVLRIFSRRRIDRRDSDLLTILKVGLATIPAGIIGLLSSDYLAQFYDSGEWGEIPNYVTLTAMAVIGYVFLIIHKLFTQKKSPLEKLSWKGALIIGISQALALVRGVSRSGITLIAGQLVGLDRVSAAKFSFLVSIPLISASSILGIYQLAQLPTSEFASQAVPAAIGLLAAAISGYLAIDYLLSYLKQKNLSAFGWYRIVFALMALLLILSS